MVGHVAKASDRTGSTSGSNGRSSNIISGSDSRLALFLQLERDCRAAVNLQALGFVVCNGPHSLISYDVALLLSAESGRARVLTVSGVSEFDSQAPTVLMAESLINTTKEPLTGAQIHDATSLQNVVSSDLVNLGFSACVSLTLPDTSSVLIILKKSAWSARELQVLLQFSEVAGHAMAALHQRESRSLFANVSLKRKQSGHRAVGLSPIQGLLRPSLVLALILGIGSFPVSQSIIAPAEITASASQVIGAGLNGVIKQIWVKPNASVKRGDRLVTFDATEILSQQQRLDKELALAEENLRKARQSTLSTAGSPALLNEFETRIALKKLELEFTQEQAERLEIRSPSNGIVRFSRVSDWEGRAVATGEKVMEIADADGKLFEIMVAVDDAINLPAGSSVKFFPDAYPLQSMDARVDSMSFFAVKVDDAAMAYRVLAEPDPGGDQSGRPLRLGMQGSARLYGEDVPLAYYLFRKPMGAIRRYVGI